MAVWQTVLFMKGVGVRRQSFVSEWGLTDASCESVRFYMSCLFSWLRWRDMGSGFRRDPVIRDHCFGFFFVFQFLVELCVWVNLKRMNKDLYKLAFPGFNCSFITWKKYALARGSLADNLYLRLVFIWSFFFFWMQERIQQLFLPLTKYSTYRSNKNLFTILPVL